jgi:alkylated DNA repair dioxygenase AlkB
MTALLFTDQEDTINLLPYDGTVHYYGAILEKEDADFYFRKLKDSIDWKNDEVVIYGKHFITKRKTAWYGDENFAYTYSQVTRYALKWTTELLHLKKIIENKTSATFNSCLLNLYHDGNEGMTWHSDDEKTLGKNNIIASLSLGAERKFCFRHKKNSYKTELYLPHGSLLVMKDNTQECWQHCLPKSKKIKEPRINLTFRTIILPDK